MNSPVSTASKAAQREEILKLSPDERVELALALGRRDVEIYAEGHGISVAEARAVLRANKERIRRVR